MKSHILILSPRDPGILGLTLQSLFITSTYSDINISVLLTGDEDEQTDQILASLTGKLTSHKGNGPKGLCENLFRIIHETEEETIFTIVPPGSVFLKESWVDLLSKLFINDLSVIVASSQWQYIDTGDGQKKYPHPEGLLSFKSQDFIGDRLFSIVTLGVFLTEKARSENHQIAEIPSNCLHVYESALPLIPTELIKREWTRSLAIVQDHMKRS